MITTDEAVHLILNQLNTPVFKDPGKDSTAGQRISAAFGAEYTGSLSSGEAILVRVAQCVWNGSGGITLAEIMQLQPGLRKSVLNILSQVLA